MRTRLRCASVRGFRSAGLELFLAIQKYLQPEIVSGYLISNSETLSVLLELPAFVNSGKEYRQIMNQFAIPRPRRNPDCADSMRLGERELAAFFEAVKELFGSELAELSAKEWLRELEATDDLPASSPEWRTLTAKASLWLANRVNALSLTTEFATT
jgi:hypothetical protein